MHKILLAAQQLSSASAERLKNRAHSYKPLIYLDILKHVYLLGNPVGPLIFKAWRRGRGIYQQSYPQKIWASSTSVYESTT